MLNIINLIAMKNNCIPVGSRKNIECERILYFQSDSNYTKVFLVDGKMFLSSTTLKTIESRLFRNPEFLKINRGIVINRNHVKHYRQDTVELLNDLILVVSRRRKTHLNIN